MLFLSDVLQIKNKQLYIAGGFCVICFSFAVHLLKYVKSLISVNLTV